MLAAHRVRLTAGSQGSALQRICLSSFRISSFILERKFYLCSPLLWGDYPPPTKSIASKLRPIKVCTIPKRCPVASIGSEVWLPSHHASTMGGRITHTYNTPTIYPNRAAAFRERIVSWHSRARTLTPLDGKRDAVESYEVLPRLSYGAAAVRLWPGLNNRTNVHMTLQAYRHSHLQCFRFAR